MTNTVKIDWNKPLRTKRGDKVRRVLCLDAIDLAGAVLVERMDGCVMRFTIDGKSPYCDDNLENYSELSELPMDTLIWVKDSYSTHWVPRYFASERNGRAACWNSGSTSKTAMSVGEVREWELYSIPRPEGYTHWTDNPKETL